MEVRDRAILDLLDPSIGGAYSGDAEYLRARLEERGLLLAPEAVGRLLGHLVARGLVEPVNTEDGTIVYTRPGVLLGAPGVVGVGPRPRASSRPPA